MAGSKSDRKIDATFNIFANNQDANDAVRVGYIDPKRGYISGLTVYEANKFAERNPGTQFIIANRDKVRYININEVNRLKNSDTLPKHRPSGLVDRNSDEFDPCNTVRGFKTDPDTLGEPEIRPLIEGDSGNFDATPNYDRYGSDSSKCRTRIELQGGGGIGAVATPIIGKDGSIIHVRVVHGGFGYQFPPQVRIVDDCRRGAGARGYSRLGSTGYVEENFDEDADVENYDFSLGEYNFDPDDSPWGSVYSMDNQTVIGDWNPANVISLTSKTGFHKELQDYLGFLKGYDPNKPWWTTRDETPVRVTGDGKSKKSNRLRGILFPVEHPAWKSGGNKAKNSFMNNYAVSPQLESDQPGTDKAGRPYSFFYKEYFPHDGVYTFRGSSDNISEIIFDGESIMDISNTFNKKPVKVKKKVKEGLHEIRIDLLNSPQKVKPKPITKDLSITYYGLNKGITKTIRGEKSYAIRTEGASRTAGRRVRDNGRTVEFDDDATNGFDVNARLKIESTSPGVSAKFNGNGTQMIVKGKGTVSLKFSWDDKPNISGLSVGTLKVGNGDKVSWTSRQRGTKGSDSKTIAVSAEDSTEVLGTGGFTVSRNNKSVKMRDGDGKDINSTFSIEDSTNNARFSGDGKRLITDGPGNVQLKLNWNDDPNKFGVAVEKITVGGVVLTQSGEKGNVTKTLSIQADGFTVGDGNIPVAPLKSFNQFKSIGTIFNTADYIKKANRPLYKVRPGVGKSGDFFSRNGVTPFNPVELDPEIPAVPPTVPPKPFKKPQAKFIKRGNDLFLKIIGDGRAKINFRLKTDDNQFISGVFAREIRIQAAVSYTHLTLPTKRIV